MYGNAVMNETLDENLRERNKDTILSYPLNKIRYWASEQFAARAFSPKTFETLVERVRPLARDPAVFEDELSNVRAALETGRAPNTPNLSQPHTQLLWGAALATIVNTPALMKSWEQENVASPLTALPLWSQLAHCPDARTELRENAFILSTSLKNPQTRIRWGAPEEGYPSVSYYFSPSENLINLDMVWSLMIGIEQSRSANLHEVGHSQGTIHQPQGVLKAREEYKATLKRVKDRKLPKEERKAARKQLNALHLDNELRYLIFDEAENNYANRYAANQSARSAQDFSVAINTLETTLCLPLMNGMSKAAQQPGMPAAPKDPTPMDYFTNLKKVLRYSFYVNNGITEDTDEGWASLGIHKEWLSGVDRDGNKIDPEQSFKDIREMCTRLEELQPTARDRLNGQAFYNNKMEECSVKRCEIIDEIYERFVTPMFPDLLKEQEKQQEENKKNQKNQQGQQQQQQSGGGGGGSGMPQDSDPQDSDDNDDSDNDNENDGQDGQQQQQGQSQSGQGRGQSSQNGEADDLDDDEDGDGEGGSAGDTDIQKKIEEMKKQMSDSIKKMMDDAEKDAKGDEKDDKGKDGDKKDGKDKDSNKDKGESMEDLIKKENNDQNTQQSNKSQKDSSSEDKQSPNKGERQEVWEGQEKSGGKPSVNDFLPKRLRQSNEYREIVSRHEQTARRIKNLLTRMQNEYFGKEVESRKRTLVPEDDDINKFDLDSYVDRRKKLATGQSVDERDFEHFKVRGEKEKTPAPIDIAILIDRSGSMGHGKGSKLDVALATACVLYEAARKNPYFNVYITAMGEPKSLSVAEPGQSSDEIAKKIMTVQDVCGGCQDHMKDAILSTMDKIKGNKKQEYSGTSHFFVISDGNFGDEASSVPLVKEICSKTRNMTFNFILTEKNRNKIEALSDEMSKGMGSERIDRVHISGESGIDAALTSMLNRRMVEMKRVPAQLNTRKSAQMGKLLDMLGAQKKR